MKKKAVAKYGKLDEFLNEIREFLKTQPEGKDSQGLIVWSWNKADANKFARICAIVRKSNA